MIRSEMCSGSEAGSYLRLIDFVYYSTTDWWEACGAQCDIYRRDQVYDKVLRRI